MFGRLEYGPCESAMELELVFVVAVVASAAGCALAQSPAPVELGVGAPAKELSDTESGAVVGLSPGQKLTVRLPAQMGTGFSWQVRQSGNLQLESKTTRRTAQSPGGQEEQVFEFTGLSPGKEKLTLEYKRPWELGVAPAKQFEITVDVKR